MTDSSAMSDERAPDEDAKGAPLPDVEHPEIGILVAMAYRAMAERHQILMSAHGIQSFRPAYGYIFRALHPRGASLKELAELAQISKQAVSQIVDGLEDLGLAERQPDPTDGRSKIVRITTRGERFLDVAITCWEEIEQEWTELIGERDIRTVRRALESYVSTYGDWRSGERPRVRPVW